MKKGRVRKILLRAFLALTAALVLFIMGTYIFHVIKSKEEITLLKGEGYYNPVSVGDYCLNVAKFGNEQGKHKIIAMAGLSSGDFPVSMRQMTAPLEEDNLLVFVDRAGYGFSDDTNNDMTLEYIVSDYRKALKNAGIEAPYILMPHSIAGAYATYWVSNYPEEIEAVVFIDGTELSEDGFDEPDYEPGIGDRILAGLAKMGMSRYVLRHYFYLYPDNFSEKEQYLGDSLIYMTLDSVATVSEDGHKTKNVLDAFTGIVTNDVPKLYICASWGFKTKEDVIESNKWINRQIEKNNLKFNLKPVEYDDEDEELKKLLDLYEEERQNILYPYIEKMGNCQIVCLSGDHMIYEHKPEECAEVVMEFLSKLD